MDNTKQTISSRLEQWKSAASQLISGSEEKEEATIIELDPIMLEKCQRQAQEQQTTVSAVIHDIMQQYWSQTSNEHMQPITPRQLELNPILYLDSLSNRDFRSYGGDVIDEE
jgi:hypothetical protein